MLMQPVEAHVPPRTMVEARLQAQRAIAQLDVGYRMFQVFAFGKAYHEVHGSWPSYRIIGEELDMTKGNVCRTVSCLEARGLAVREGSGREPRLRLRNPPPE